MTTSLYYLVVAEQITTAEYSTTVLLGDVDFSLRRMK
jgi:hypothetical protein